MESEGHAHALEHLDVVVDLELVVEGEEVLHLVAGDGAVDDRLLARVDDQEGQLDRRRGRRAAVAQPLHLLVALHQRLERHLERTENLASVEGSPLTMKSRRDRPAAGRAPGAAASSA